MMKFVLVAVFAGTLLLTGSCKSVKSANGGEVKQGINGKVLEMIGDQMPAPGMEKSGRPLATTVYVYELTNLKNIERNPDLPFFKTPSTRLVAQSVSDTSGKFSIQLPTGTYSLFIDRDGKLYANSFDQYNNIMPVTIEKNKATAVNINVTDKATF